MTSAFQLTSGLFPLMIGLKKVEEHLTFLQISEVILESLQEHLQGLERGLGIYSDTETVDKIAAARRYAWTYQHWLMTYQKALVLAA